MNVANPQPKNQTAEDWIAIVEKLLEKRRAETKNS
jgi:hypothetical protein